MPSFFKRGKSKKKLSASAASVADESAGPPSSHHDALDSPTSANGEHPGISVVTPQTSPQEASSAVDAGEISPPNSPASQSSRTMSGSSLRPLRLGSFNFDHPNTNTSYTDGGGTNNQTRALNFPPLYHEADDMLNLSNLIYTLAELRDLARNGVLNNPLQSMRILELPLPLETALKIIVEEGELLREVLDDGKHEATLSSLESLLARQEEAREVQRQAEMAKSQKNNNNNEEESKKDDGLFGWMQNWDGCLAGGFSFDEMFCGGDLGMVDPPAAKAAAEAAAAHVNNADERIAGSSVLTAMGDLKSDEELVYAVGVNPIEERITVVFRGSVTKADFMTDATISIVQAPDPRAFNGTQKEEDINAGDVGIHQGFYEYLFGTKGNGGKYMEIMKHVHGLIAESPSRRNYKLYITGHSLGGALATLFGFYACASSTLPLPLTVVSVASPRVGSVNFAQTFAELESQGKIRHLRIANHKDPVTLGPTISSKRALALSAKMFSPLGYLALMVSGNGEGGEEEKYYHTGIKMKLYKSISSVSSRRCELSYSGATIISGAKRPVAIDKDDLAEIESSNRKKKGSSSELPMVSYHYGTAYSERMALVEKDLQGIMLNDLYRESASGMPWLS